MPDTPDDSLSEQPVSQPTYWRDEWSAPAESPSEVDPKLLREMEAYISWRTVKQELGQAIVLFQILESSIKDAISKLLDSTDFRLGRIVTAGMDFRRMLSLLFKLFYHRFPESDKLKELESILDACDKCRIKRNALVHSYWQPDENGLGLRLKIQQGSIGKPYDPQLETVTPESVKADGEKSRECSIRLGKFFEAYFPDWKSS